MLHKQWLQFWLPYWQGYHGLSSAENDLLTHCQAQTIELGLKLQGEQVKLETSRLISHTHICPVVGQTFPISSGMWKQGGTCQWDKWKLCNCFAVVAVCGHSWIPQSPLCTMSSLFAAPLCFPRHESWDHSVLCVRSWVLKHQGNCVECGREGDMPKNDHKKSPPGYCAGYCSRS